MDRFTPGEPLYPTNQLGDVTTYAAGEALEPPILWEKDQRGAFIPTGMRHGC